MMSVMILAPYQLDPSGNFRDCNESANSYCSNQLLGTRCDPYGIVNFSRPGGIGADQNLK